MASRTVVPGGALLVTVAMLLAAVATTAAATAGSWAPVTFPAREIADNYQASCVSTRSCFLIGSQGTYRFMRYDGRRVLPLPAPDRADSRSQLGGLACRSTRFCMMVGQNRHQFASAERWDGRRWTATTVPSPRPADAVRAGFVIAALTSVACPSSSMCIAVGGWVVYRRGLGPGRHTPTGTSIAARFDGERWRAVQVPRHSGVLTSIACPSTTSCTAVGGFPSRVAIALVLHGSRWSRTTLPAVAGSTDSEPSSISCTAPGTCVAVGSARRTRLIDGNRKEGYLHSLVWRERADRWSARLLPGVRTRASAAASRQQQLNAVSCPPGQPISCVAVGSFSGTTKVANGGFSAMIGARSIVQQPLALDPGPDTISCPTAGFCLAAGNESIETFRRGN